MLSFKQYNEEKAYFANKSYDKDGFPNVDRDFMQYSKAATKSLKELCSNYKLDHRGTKKQLITRILQHLHSPAEVSGYYNRTGDKAFKHIRKGENTATAPRSYEKVDEAWNNKTRDFVGAIAHEKLPRVKKVLAAIINRMRANNSKRDDHDKGRRARLEGKIADINREADRMASEAISPLVYLGGAAAGALTVGVLKAHLERKKRARERELEKFDKNINPGFDKMKTRRGPKPMRNKRNP